MVAGGRDGSTPESQFLPLSLLAMTPKEQLHRLVDMLPDAQPEAQAIEALQYRLFVLEKVQRGVQDADAVRVVSHEKVRVELRKWLDE